MTMIFLLYSWGSLCVVGTRVLSSSEAALFGGLRGLRNNMGVSRGLLWVIVVIGIHDHVPLQVTR